MSKVKSILRLLNEGVSKRQISERLRVSRDTVDKYEGIFRQHPFSLSELSKLSHKELYTIIAPVGKKEKGHEVLYGEFAGMEGRLKQVGVTKLMLWEQYKEKHRDGVQYSQFCEHFKRYEKSQELSYVHDHKAGDKLMVDYAGKKLQLIDADSGLIRSVEVMVCILPCSGYTYAKAMYSQQSEDFLQGLVDCMDYLGGVPSAVVTDNLKPAVNRASKYDPEINLSLSHLAEHYGFTVLPTRARKPKDKALVENAVNLMYSRVYAPLHDQDFYTLSSLNAAISRLIDQHNRLLMQKKPYSRWDQFERFEKSQLNVLPVNAYVLRKYQKAKVHPNCHVLHSEDKHHYSVPYAYVGQQVQISYTADEIEIYAQYQRIAVHQRVRQPYSYTTNESHLHPTHRYYQAWSEQHFITQGLNIGAQTHQLIQQIFKQCKHPEQGYKLCQGVLQLAKKHTPEQMENAAAVCMQYQRITYKVLDYILNHYVLMTTAQNEVQPNHYLPEHENIRGQGYYY